MWTLLLACLLACLLARSDSLSLSLSFLAWTQAGTYYALESAHHASAIRFTLVSSVTLLARTQGSAAQG